VLFSVGGPNDSSLNLALHSALDNPQKSVEVEEGYDGKYKSITYLLCFKLLWISYNCRLL